MEIKKVCVLGTGLMGGGIAQVCATKGFNVSIRDLETKYIDAGFDSIRKSLSRFVKAQKIKQEDVELILSRIEGTTDLKEAVSGCDIVIECIPEDLELKRRVLRQVEDFSPEHTILASNTSAIMITDIASATSRPENVIGMHWSNPAPLMKSIEVVKGALTSDGTCKSVMEFSFKLGKEPFLVNDGPGFFTTRYINTYLAEAIRLFESGVAGIKEIDQLSRLMYGWPMGPIELLDMVGLDTFVHTLSYLYAETGEPKFMPPLILKKLVKSGYIGNKPASKGGFYDYFKIEKGK